MKTLKLFACLFGMHKWTSVVKQGKLGSDRTKDILSASSKDIMTLFDYHCRMWCERCGHFSELNHHKSTEKVLDCKPWSKP